MALRDLASTAGVKRAVFNLRSRTTDEALAHVRELARFVGRGSARAATGGHE